MPAARSVEDSRLQTNSASVPAASRRGGDAKSRPSVRIIQFLFWPLHGLILRFVPHRLKVPRGLLCAFICRQDMKEMSGVNLPS